MRIWRNDGDCPNSRARKGGKENIGQMFGGDDGDWHNSRARKEGRERGRGRWVMMVIALTLVHVRGGEGRRILARCLVVVMVIAPNSRAW